MIIALGITLALVTTAAVYFLLIHKGKIQDKDKDLVPDKVEEIIEEVAERVDAVAEEIADAIDAVKGKSKKSKK